MVKNLVHINVEPIGLDQNPIAVMPSVAVIELAEDLQIKMLELDKKQLKDVDALEAAKTSRDITRQMKIFLKDVLGLSDKTLKKVWESIDLTGLTTYVAYVISRLQGASEAEAAKALHAVPDDQAEVPKENGSKE